MQAESKGLPERWTSELLRRCTPKEIIIIIAAYGVSTVAERVGDAEYQKIVEKVINQ